MIAKRMSSKLGDLEHCALCNFHVQENMFVCFNTGKRLRTTSEAEREEMRRTRRIGASLPVILDRPAWFLDFPKWQELRATAGNGVRKDSCVTFSQDHSNRRQQRADKLKVKQVCTLMHFFCFL